MDEIPKINMREDRRLAKRIKKALSKNHIIDTSNIYIDVIDSTVTIRGEVTTIAEKLFAEEVASAVPGTRQVVNHIKVYPQYPTNDAEIAGDILECLSLILRLDLSAVFVKVANGVAFLRGAVPSARYKLVAESITRKVPQIVEVVNELNVVPVKAKRYREY